MDYESLMGVHFNFVNRRGEVVDAIVVACVEDKGYTIQTPDGEYLCCLNNRNDPTTVDLVNEDIRETMNQIIRHGVMPRNVAYDINLKWVGRISDCPDAEFCAFS
jgi:hypothetical protein